MSFIILLSEIRVVSVKSTDLSIRDPTNASGKIPVSKKSLEALYNLISHLISACSLINLILPPQNNLQSNQFQLFAFSPNQTSISFGCHHRKSEIYIRDVSICTQQIS